MENVKVNYSSNNNNNKALMIIQSGVGCISSMHEQFNIEANMLQDHSASFFFFSKFLHIESPNWTSIYIFPLVTVIMERHIIHDSILYTQYCFFFLDCVVKLVNIRDI